MRAAVREFTPTSGSGDGQVGAPSLPWQRPDRDVAAAAAGDVGAFERLYRAHVGRVYGLCLRMTGDRATAEEMTQEAFLRAWQKLASFRGASAFSSWLFRLTSNLVISSWRGGRAARRLDLGLDEAAAAERPAPAGDPVGRLDLERSVARLPRGARFVFVLHDIEGLAHEEIAALAGIAVGTSKAQLHRARRLLREALQ